LLKLGARVLVSVRRVVVHLPSSFPFLPAFRQVALALVIPDSENVAEAARLPLTPT
jgi:hypothetical protein